MDGEGEEEAVSVTSRVVVVLRQAADAGGSSKRDDGPVQARAR